MQNKKTLFFEFALPSRLLYYVNIVKGECTAKQKNTFFEFALPSRLLTVIAAILQVTSKFRKE